MKAFLLLFLLLTGCASVEPVAHHFAPVYQVCDTLHCTRCGVSIHQARIGDSRTNPGTGCAAQRRLPVP